jgi:hypothetical protein
VYLGINTVQHVEHLHVQAEIVHGDIPVFRHDEVEADEAGIGLHRIQGRFARTPSPAEARAEPGIDSAR